MKAKNLASPQAPQTIRADTFVAGHAKARPAPEDDDPVTLVTYIPLTSESQPDVRALECRITGFAAFTRHLTITPIRGALGDLMTLALPVK